MANHRAEKPSASRRRSADPKGRAARSRPTASQSRAARPSERAARTSEPVYPGTIHQGTVYPGTVDPGTVQQGTVDPGTVDRATAPRAADPGSRATAPRAADPGSRATAPRTATTGGKRKAVKPSRSAKPSRAPKPSRSARPSPEPKPSRSARPSPEPKPSRSARPSPEPKPSRSTARKNPLTSLPSPPSLVGAAALALAAVGAVTVTGGSGFASGGFQKAAAQASVLNGASSIGSSDALSGRQRAVSRDSERQALQDAADQRLQAAAEAQAKQRNAALAALAASAEKHATAIARNAWQLPIPLGVYHLTARFGQCSGLWSHCHTGLDFAAPAGTPIQAIAAGVVTDVGWAGAYGNRTVITLSDGTELWYAHQTSYNVSVGEKISAGQVIGTVGATGNVTGPHLHVEVRPGAGDPVDPYAAFVAHGISPG